MLRLYGDVITTSSCWLVLKELYYEELYYVTLWVLGMMKTSYIPICIDIDMYIYIYLPIYQKLNKRLPGGISIISINYP